MYCYQEGYTSVPDPLVFFAIALLLLLVLLWILTRGALAEAREHLAESEDAARLLRRQLAAYRRVARTSAATQAEMRADGRRFARQVEDYVQQRR